MAIEEGIPACKHYGDQPFPELPRISRSVHAVQAQILPCCKQATAGCIQDHNHHK